MASDIIVIRIDPVKRAVARLMLHAPRSPAMVLRNVKRLARAKVVQAREIVAMDPVPLMLAAGMDIDETMPGWAMPGLDDTAGIGILFGRGPGGGMTDVPVSIDWVRKRVRWVDCPFEDEDDPQESVPK